MRMFINVLKETRYSLDMLRDRKQAIRKKTIIIIVITIITIILLVITITISQLAA